MKLHEWQDKRILDKAMDVAHKSLAAGASEESAKRAGAVVLDRLFAERQYESEVQDIMRERGWGRRKAEDHHRYIHGDRGRYLAQVMKSMKEQDDE